jgi:hypothetical protein
MMQPVVLVTFHSRCGTTETLALAAAVGAVQARALIRLRRLPDTGKPDASQVSPDCADTLQRMHKEYVAPAEADVLGADAIIVAPSAGSSTSTPEWIEFLRLLARLQADGRLAGKAAAVVDGGDAATVGSFTAAIGQLGFAFSPPGGTAPADSKEAAVALGRAVADTARALKQTVG